MLTYLLLGSNQGDREKMLLAAHAKIGKQVGKILSESSIIESEPWGFESTLWFYNQVLVVDTHLNSFDLLRVVHVIEDQIGRRRVGNLPGYQSRCIDIDILYYGEEVIDTSDLVIPHPHIADRVFTLVLLYELSPYGRHPVLQKTHCALRRACRDKTRIRQVKKTKKNI